MTEPALSPAPNGPDALFRPFHGGGLSLPNRVVMAPMTRSKSPGGVPGEDVAAYYARRAAGGAGLIVTEGTYIDHPSAGTSHDIPLFHGEQSLAGWKRVVEAVHAVGGQIVPQLWHVGAARSAGAGPIPDAPVVGPSGIGLDGEPIPGDRSTLTTADLDDILGAFASAAASAHRLGFDGLELHGAHGYLLDQFLWATTNRRTDGYGGDIASRTRFLAEVVAAVRGAVPVSFPVILRLSQWKLGAYDARLAQTPTELEQLLTPLAEAGVDVFHASTRRYWLPEFEGADLNFAGWTKKITGRPTISVGSVGLDGEFIKTFAGAIPGRASIEPLLERLERDEFDLVAVGRALLADPEWPNKVRDGRTDEITPFSPTTLGTLY